MESQLYDLLSCRGDDIAALTKIRSQAERKDALNGIVRDALSRSSIRYIGGVLHYFNGMVYVPCSLRDVQDALVNVLLDMGVGASDVGRLGDTSFSQLKRSCADENVYLLGFENCVLNLATGEVLSFSPTLVVTHRLPYQYIADAACPAWESFLAEVLPDESERNVLQEFFGMCLIDRNVISIEKMALLVGSGANGKSVVCDVIKAVFGGNEYVGNLSPDQLQDARQISSLVGKRLNIAPDVRRGASFDSALKALASSQEVTAWKLYEGGMTVKCPPLAFALNEMPYFRDTTSAFFRRLLVFRFDVVIPERRQDRYLASRIIANERPGVFRWVLDGMRRLVANRGAFSPSLAMDFSLASLCADVRTSQSKLLQYLDGIGYGLAGEVAENVPAEKIAEGAGMSRHAVTKELKKAGVECVRTASGMFYKLYKI